MIGKSDSHSWQRAFLCRRWFSVVAHGCALGRAFEFHSARNLRAVETNVLEFAIARCGKRSDCRLLETPGYVGVQPALQDGDQFSGPGLPDQAMRQSRRARNRFHDDLRELSRFARNYTCPKIRVLDCRDNRRDHGDKKWELRAHYPGCVSG